MNFRYGPAVSKPAREKFETPPLYCLKCGYDLRMLSSPRCSECGTKFEYDEWLRVVYSIEEKLPWLDDEIRRVNSAWLWGAAALALLLIHHMTDPMGPSFFFSMICAAVSSYWLVGVVRLRGLPPWSMERLSCKPDRIRLCVAGFLLLLFAVGAFFR